MKFLLVLISTFFSISSFASKVDCSLDKINHNNRFFLEEVDSGFSGFWKTPGVAEVNCYMGGYLTIYTTPDNNLRISGSCLWGNYSFIKQIPDLLMTRTSEEGVFDLTLNSMTVGKFNTKAGAPYIMWNIQTATNTSIGLIQLSCNSYPYDNIGANFRFVDMSKSGFSEFRGNGRQKSQD